MPRTLPQSRPSHRGVFTTRKAHLSGWTDRALANAVRTGRLVRLARGAYVPITGWAGVGPEADRNRLAIRAIAAVLTIRLAVASHASAAVLAELPVWALPARPCVTVPPRYTGDARHAHLHRASAPGRHVHAGAQVPRFASARTVLDLAREHGIEDAVVAGDAALARGLLDTGALMRCARDCAGWPGMRRAERAIALLDGRSESPLESVSRLRLTLAGVEAPEPQVKIYSTAGVFLGRTDLYWEEFGVAGEVDGRLKYRVEPDEAFWREKRRQEAMENVGVTFVRWGRRDLDDVPALMARLAAAFRRGARNPRSDRAWIAVTTPRLAPPIDALDAG